MERDPRLGSLSGEPSFYRDPEREDELVSENCGYDMSVGMIKFYRTDCFQEIGGFVRAVMWDGIDAHTCRMLGWKNFAVPDPELRFIHLRPMGSSDKNILRGRLRWGAGQWFMGTGPLYMLASAVYRMSTRPYILGGLCMLLGYLRACLGRAPRYENLEFRSFLRRYQRLALLKGRTAAATAVLAERPALRKA